MGLAEISVPAPSSDTDEQRASLSESLTPPPTPPLVLRVSLRPLRVFALTVLAVVSISLIVIFFHLGHDVKHFKSDAYTKAEQDKLVDRYNSYAGNVGTAFGKPIELFVTAAVQVLMLRFLAAQLLHPEPDRRVTGLVLALTTGMGYLLNSGFGALNVQIRERNIQPSILTSDLTAEFNNTALKYADSTTSVNRSVSELNRFNPIANTVLRSLVLPRKALPMPQCNWANSQADFKDHVATDVLEFGMPQRDWMESMVPEALDAQRLRVVLNATDANANKNVSAADLPMDASRAANLLVHSLFLSSQYIPWGKTKAWEVTSPANVREIEGNVSTATLMGLLPPPGKSELEQRTWLLKETEPLINRLFDSGAPNMSVSTSDISMEFSHTQLSPLLSFDAVTFEIDVDPKLYTTSTDAKKNRLLKLDPYQCSPWPGRCLIEKKGSPPLSDTTAKSLYDAPMLVHAYAICVDDTGAEAVTSRLMRNDILMDYNVGECTATSSSSLLLVSVGKRLVADSLVEKVPFNTTDTVGESPVATNVRKIYSFTVGRLGWTAQNLSQAFHAVCDADRGDCMGLSFELADLANQLVVGKDALPLNLVSPVFFGSRVVQRPTPLVQITEPPREADHFQYNVVAGDILYPHNIKDLQWTPTRTDTGTSCSAVQEDRVRRVLDNHMYMETTRQATYTAGLFFLFQNAVVREIIFIEEDNGRTLAFDGNVRDLALMVSTPLENTLLTLGGCVALVVGLLIGWLSSLCGRAAKKPDPLANITEPHVIARAMLDESQFPALLLRRRVMDNRSDSGVAQRKLKGFAIQSLELLHQSDSGESVETDV